MNYEGQSTDGETYEASPAVPEKASGMAIAALIFAILSLPCCCGILGAIPAFILGLIENSRINRGVSSPKGKGFAITAMIMGIFFGLLGCVQVVWLVAFGGIGILQGLAHH